jgi:hypothetical protein
MYVTPEQAKSILRQRRSDLVLRRKVQNYLGELPAFLQQGPKAVIARQLASPTLEFQNFAALADQVGLPPVALDFSGDKFYSGNPDKLALGKMMFHHGKGRNGGDKITPRRVIDFNHWDGKPADQIKTLWGEGFVDFHHRLLTSYYPEVNIFDCTEWLRTLGGKPELFWPRVFGLFVCDCILFDNFHEEGHEKTFTRDIIRPALAQVEEQIGHAPLIVPLVPQAQEQERYWSWYPGEVEDQVWQALKTPSRVANTQLQS